LGVVDRVGGDHHVDLVVGDDVFADLRGCLGVDDLVGRDAELGGDDLGDLDVEAFRFAVEAFEAEQGLVELRADPNGAGRGELGHGGALREGGAAGHGWGAGGRGAEVGLLAAGGQGQTPGQQHGGELAERHAWSS